MGSNDARPESVAADVPQPHVTRRSILARAGLVAGGVGVAVLHAPAEASAARLTSPYELEPPAGSHALKILPSGAVAPSASTGGALNLDNSASSGAGAVFYSDRGADALGRLLVVNQSNPANPQHAVRIQNAGTAHTVSVFHDPAGGAGDSNALALDVVSTNRLDTTLGVHGREEGKGTVKITHEKPDGPDADASAISIALRGAGTACQGIFIGNDAGEVTTGNLLNIRNGGPGSERLVLRADGQLEVAGEVHAPSIHLDGPNGSARIYVKSGKLIAEWNDGSRTLYTSVRLDTPGPYPAAAQVTTDTTPP